jgi:excisionase family DNA binding protein
MSTFLKTPNMGSGGGSYIMASVRFGSTYIAAVAFCSLLGANLADYNTIGCAAETRPTHMLFENQLFNYKEAARFLSISEPYLRRLKQRGKIPYVKIGRGIRFRLSSLNSWVEKREIK